MGGGPPAVNTTDRIKLWATTPRFTPGPTLKAKKPYLNCLTLPDGALLEAGGGTYMPTGYYRMWAVDGRGAVSKAKWVYVCHPSTEGTECRCC